MLCRILIYELFSRRLESSSDAESDSRSSESSSDDDKDRHRVSSRNGNLKNAEKKLPGNLGILSISLEE